MLGAELRKARLTAGMTQEQLAFAAEVDRSYISQLENDHRSPTMDLFFRLCEAMGASPASLVGRVERYRQKSRP